MRRRSLSTILPSGPGRLTGPGGEITARDVGLRSVAPAALMVVVMALPLGACQHDPLGAGAGTRYVEQSFGDDLQDGHPDVDLLFVVADSAGMAGKQQALAAGFPALLRALTLPAAGLGGGLPDLRVGVVSADLGAPGSHLAGCELGDRAVLRAPVEGCAAAPDGRFLITLDGGARTNFKGDPAAAFSCLGAALGSGGCGFEQPLAAARRALDQDQPVENDGFHREGALLGVMILADEDDCSAPAGTDLFEPSTARYGPQGLFRCSEFGHLCGGQRPPRAGSPAPLTGCVSAEGAGKLTPVSDTVAFFRSLVPSERLVVSVLSGPVDPYAVRLDGSTPQLGPSCNAPTVGDATPGVRLRQFAAAFGARGDFASACDGDLSPALTRFGQSIAQQLGTACLVAAPTRGDGGAPECWVTESAGGLGREVQLPRCAAGGPRPCFTLVESRARCETSGQELRIDRGEAAPLPGTTDTLRCRVCTSQGDPRCL
jgi:hypothetical protein